MCPSKVRFILKLLFYGLLHYNLYDRQNRAFKTKCIRNEFRDYLEYMYLFIELFAKMSDVSINYGIQNYYFINYSEVICFQSQIKKHMFYHK